METGFAMDLILFKPALFCALKIASSVMVVT